jgi:hypothetical protein
MKKLILVFTLAVWFIGYAVAQSPRAAKPPKISVRPEAALVDEAVSIAVSGLAPKQAATIKATMTDNNGATWQSSAEFIADGKGAVDPGKHTPA